MTATIEELKTTSLYYREGSSDKEYHVRLEPKDDGFVVNIAYGRRGSTLSTGTKTSAPVYYDAALMVFDKLVKEKKAKGYTEGENGTPYQHKDKQVSGLMPQLLNSVDEVEVARLVSNPNWAMQEKQDGRRMLLRKTGNIIEGINKKGLLVSVPEPIVQTARTLKGDFILDGEAIGDRLHAFDLLGRNGNDLRKHSCHNRYGALLTLLGGGDSGFISIVDCWTDSIDKASWLNTLKQQKAEGVVLSSGTRPTHRVAPTAAVPNSNTSSSPRSVQWLRNLTNSEAWPCDCSITKAGSQSATSPSRPTIPCPTSEPSWRFGISTPCRMARSTSLFTWVSAAMSRPRNVSSRS